MIDRQIRIITCTGQQFTNNQTSKSGWEPIDKAQDTAINPFAPQTCPHCGIKVKKGPSVFRRLMLFLAIVLLLGGVGVGVYFAPQLLKGTSEAAGFEYEVFDERETDAGTVWRAVIKSEKIPNESQLGQIAAAMWKDGNQQCERFSAFLYLPDMDTEWAAYCIGEFTKGGLDKLEVIEP